MLTRAAMIAVLLIVPVVATSQPVAGQRPNPNRVALERQLRERTAQITRERLGLNDAQMQQLQRVNGRFAPQHTALAMKERDTRRQLRQETMATSPNQASVSSLLDATINLQRQRLALVEAEQKELAAFLTPVQRARYIALQGQFRRAAEQLARPGQAGRRNNMRRPGPGAENRP
jgi:Spy/CpxP family protein refolding chaperone